MELITLINDQYFKKSVITHAMRGDIIPYNLISNCLSQISISKNLMGFVAGVACKVVLATNYSKLLGRGCILVGWESSFIWRVFVLL